MKKLVSALVLALGLSATAASAQEPGAHVGASFGYVDVDTYAGSGGKAAGVNFGYGFNEIVGLDFEYTHKSGGRSGNLISAFVTFTSTGDTYFKGKVGMSSGRGNAFDGSSGSIGAGFGTKVTENVTFEADVTMYGSDTTGANLILKYNF